MGRKQRGRRETDGTAGGNREWDGIEIRKIGGKREGSR
jgi:hypothetical protein